jgi:hypothetical protein
MTTRNEFIKLCCSSLSILDALERGDIGSVADRIIDDLVDELRDIDSSIPKSSHYEWFLVLGHLRREIEEQLISLMKDRVQLRAMIHAIVNEGRNAL